MSVQAFEKYQPIEVNILENKKASKIRGFLIKFL